MTRIKTRPEQLTVNSNVFVSAVKTKVVPLSLSVQRIPKGGIALQ